MGIFNFFRSKKIEAEDELRPRAESGQVVVQFESMDDPAFLEFMRSGGASGHYTKSMEGLRNMAVLRCVSLVSESIGMLPLNLLMRDETKAHRKEHPAYRLLRRKPNTWQTPYEFKSQMQAVALTQGEAFARVIWSRGRPIALVPLDNSCVEPKLKDDWRMVYLYTKKEGGQIELQANEVLHLRDLSVDGVKGVSRVSLAKSAISLSNEAQKAAISLFRTGVMAGGAFEVPKELTDTSYQRLKESLNKETTGAENNGKWIIAEGGAKAVKFAASAADSQQVENRNHQIEEVARAFGVPRPLLMMDDTSWGSGIEQLNIFFIQYGLQHWFTAWEEALARVLLSDADYDVMHFKFNEKALLRGTMKDQADFFKAALGSGGHQPWDSVNSVRDTLDLASDPDPKYDRVAEPPTKKGRDDESNKTT